MKLYAYCSPDIPKHAGYLKIGETHGNIERRVKQQGHELNVRKEIVWRDAIYSERTGIDKILHRHLVKQGFPIQQFDETGQDTEWVKCTVDDLERAFAAVKQKLYEEEKERQAVTDQFYLEIRNWFYWTTQENKNIDDDYALRLVVRLLFCFFLREKDELVPKELLDANILKHLKSDEEYGYYKGILYNLFFHCLNTPGERKYENEKLFANKKELKNWFSSIPFLNGGLFDIHDKDDIPIGNDYFFSGKKERTLTKLGAKCDVYGIITILSKYQYKLTLGDLLEQAEYKTVDPEFIGKVFESLLSCIDADSVASRRKVTGSYYTPREIVDYMVNESLEMYLETRAGGVSPPVLERVDSNPPEGLRHTALALVDENLLQCRILDPACGSGAFPCEAMNIIMHRIEEEKKSQENRELSASERYHVKLDIIRNVIYGVDIQPMAVQITTLRFFLSLIQDIVPDKRKPNYGIEPLPNLETKFVCADTLIGLKRKNGQRMLEDKDIQKNIKLLQDNRNRYFMASDVQFKQSLREVDESLRKILAHAMEGAFAEDTTEKMVAWNPYDPSHSSPFFDPVWMFGIEKFDIVIGNPPYGAKYPDEHKKYFKEHYVSARTTRNNGVELKGSLDTFSLFIEKGFNIVKDNGYLMFIVPLSVISSDSMTALHNLLEKHCSEIKVASFCDRPQQIFRHSHKKTTIIGFRKDNQQNKRILATQMYRKDKSISLENLIKTFRFIDVTKLGLRGRYAKISLPIEKRILRKLRSKSHTLIRDLLDENGQPIYYRSTGGMYYNVITNKTRESTKEKTLHFDKKMANVVGAILSSSLFWWYQQVYTNGLDLKTYEMESFPIPVDKLTPAIRRKIEKLYDRYLQDIERHVIERESQEYKHITKFKEYKIRYSKALIDAMDDVICPLYGLTEEETEFIKNYELRFRIDEDE